MLGRRAASPALSRRQMLGAGLVTAGALVVPSCARRAWARRKRGTIVFGVGFDLPAMQSPILGRPERLVFNRLLRFDSALRPIPELAELVAQPDDRSYVLRLRRGVRWHDGRPLSAHDVAFTVRSVLRDDVAYPMKFLFQVDGRDVAVDALDDHTVRFTLAQPHAGFLAHLAAPWVLSIGPKHLLEGRDVERNPYNFQPIGTGPFRFAEMVEGDHVRLVRNPSYFEGVPRLDEIIVRPIPDAQARLAAFHADEIDLAIEQSAEEARPFSRVPGVRVTTVLTPYVQQLALNLSDPLFGDVRVRRAIAHALDRPAFVRAVVGGAQYLARSIVGPVHWAYEDDVPFYPYDPARAEHLLASAGWMRARDGIRERQGRRFRFVCRPWRDWEQRYATLVQQYLERVGIEMVVQPVADYPTMERVRKSGEAQCLFYGCFDYEPSELHQYFHSSQHPPRGVNLWRYVNRDVDTLLDDARREPDRDRRRAMYARIQALVLEDCATIPLHVHMISYVVRDRLRGYPAPTGNWQGVLYEKPWLLRARS